MSEVPGVARVVVAGSAVRMAPEKARLSENGR
jgi:hypothetical protein